MPPDILYLDGADAERNFPHPAKAASDMAAVGTTSNSTVTVTLPANSSSPNHISSVEWSYSGTPTGGRLTIVAEDTKRDLDITVGGVNQLIFNPPLECASNQAVTLTLYPGGTGVTGKLSCVAWQLK